MINNSVAKHMRRTIAIIYCRVSSDKQVNEGHGLDGQELRCRQFAAQKGYEVAVVFKDEGVSGGSIHRPGMSQLIKFLEDNAFEDDMVVLIDDISRLARDVQAHFELKANIYSRHARIESPTHEFEDNPMGKFFETIMAGSAEYYRNENRVRVIKNMKSRLENGYWPFDVPPGLKNIKDPVHGKLLTPDEPKASVIREALLGFHSRRFETQTDVANFLQKKKFTHRTEFKGKVHLEQVERLLTRILYSGWVEYPQWKIPRRKGHHEGLITIKQFDEIQHRLKETQRTPQRQDLHKDFPLRSYLACSGCERLVTASWSKGRGKMYPYYRCITPKCPRKNKGLRSEKTEMDFGKYINQFKPKPEALKLVEAILGDLWEKRLDVAREAEKSSKAEIKDINQKVDRLCERLGNIKSEILIRKYESQIEQLESQKRILEKIKFDPKDPRYDFGTALKTVTNFMQNPSLLWNSEEFEDKRTLLKLSVLGVLPYDPQTGFGTARFPLLFELCKVAETDNKTMVEMPGVEPGSNVYARCSYDHEPFSTRILTGKGAKKRSEC